MSLEPEVLTLQSEEDTDDEGGGETVSFIDYWTGSATVNFFQRVTWERLEEGKHNTQGPGAQTLQLRLFTFEQPWPDPMPLPGQRIQRADGSFWRVQNVRPYEETLQIDGEQVT